MTFDHPSDPRPSVWCPTCKSRELSQIDGRSFCSSCGTFTDGTRPKEKDAARMAKWVTIRRKEFNRLRDAAAQTQTKYRRAAIETYNAVIAENVELKQDAEKWRCWTGGSESLSANAELGALLRNLPAGSKLYRRCVEPEWGVGMTIDNVTWCPTPDEALRVASRGTE